MQSDDITENSKLYCHSSFTDNAHFFFNGLLIVSFDIGSLSKNGHSFTPYIDGLDKKPDVIVSSETWFRPEKVGSLPGY